MADQETKLYVENIVVDKNDYPTEVVIETVEIGESNETDPIFYPIVGKPSSESTKSIQCRICYGQEPIENLITPCSCKGSIAYVHQNCLEKWLSQRSLTKCDLCAYQFDTICTRKYSLTASIRLWATHPNNRTLFLFDLISFLLLNLIAFILIAIVMHGSELFFVGNALNPMQKYRKWNFGFLLVCTTLMAFIYFMGILTLINLQIRPWFRFWRSSVNVRLKM